MNRGTAIADRRYEGFGGQRVASLSSQEQAASGIAESMAGRYQPALARANTEYNSSNLQKYMNPYVEGALNSRARRLNETFDSQGAALSRKRGMMDAFGTDRGTLLEAKLSENRARALDDMAAEGYNTAFDKANASFFQDRASNLDVASRGVAADTAAIGALQSVGQNERSLRQAQADFDYGQFLERRDWNTTNLQPLLAAIGAARTGSTTTNTQSQSTAGALVGLASTVAGAYLSGGGSLFGGAAGAASGGGGGVRSQN